jgi:general secretion pathway protein G
MQPNSPSRASKPFARASRFNSHGFTMLELLVVLGILALLATLGIMNVQKTMGNASEDAARLFLKTTLKTGLMQYSLHMNGFPTAAEGLQVLISEPANKAGQWRGPYLEGSKIPSDPWGEPYQYRFPGTKNKGSYDAWSKGPDKTDGTEDDIGNWDKEVTPAEAK